MVSVAVILSANSDYFTEINFCIPNSSTPPIKLPPKFLDAFWFTLACDSQMTWHKLLPYICSYILPRRVCFLQPNPFTGHPRGFSTTGIEKFHRFSSIISIKYSNALLESQTQLTEIKLGTISDRATLTEACHRSIITYPNRGPFS